MSPKKKNVVQIYTEAMKLHDFLDSVDLALQKAQRRVYRLERRLKAMYDQYALKRHV